MALGFNYLEVSIAFEGRKMECIRYPPKLEAAVFRVVCFDGENGKWLRCQKGPSKSDIAGFSATGAGPDHALPNGIWVSNKYYVHSLIAV